MAGQTEIRIVGVPANFTQMFIIHLRLQVAFKTTENSAIKQSRMTVNTIIPAVEMSAGEDREELRVVFGERSFLSGRMTGIAGAGKILVSGHTAVHVIHIGLVVIMTGKAGIYRTINRRGMANGTVGPFAVMRSGEDREKLGVVIGKIARFPGWVAEITILTIIIVPGHPAVNIVGIGLVMSMTIKTAEFGTIGRIYMAGIAVGPFAVVRSGEDREELRVMISEIARFPGRVAEITILTGVSIPGHPAVNIIGIGLVMSMTINTAEFGTVSRICMAGAAVGPFPVMSSGEDREELGVMIGEIARFPGRMADIAILTGVSIPGHPAVDIVGIGLVMSMAFKATEIFPVGRVDMAGVAVIPLIIMYSRKDREELSVMIAKITRFPGWVTEITVGRVVGVAAYPVMIAVGFRLVMFMTGETAEILVGAGIDMATGAVIPFVIMGSGKDREENIMIIKKRRPPAIHLVARLTLGRKAVIGVLRVLNAEIFGLMALDTAGGVERKIPRRHLFVTALAIQKGVASGDRKIRVKVHLLNIKLFPAPGGVAVFAVITHLRLVNILVAGKTVLFNFTEIGDIMTTAAIG